MGELSKLGLVLRYLAGRGLHLVSGNAQQKRESRFLFTKLYLEALSSRSRIATDDAVSVFPELSESELTLFGAGLTELVRDYSRRTALVSTPESIILAGITRVLEPKVIFEFGTFAGGTTYNFFINATPSTRIETLDRQLKADVDSKVARMFESERVRRLTGDSTAFDFSPFLGKVDLVFIDGGHDYETVSSDTRNALRIRSSDGLIVWHDYKPDHPGVFRAVNELAADQPLVHLEGTSLVVLKSVRARRRARDA